MTGAARPAAAERKSRGPLSCSCRDPVDAAARGGSSSPSRDEQTLAAGGRIARPPVLLTARRREVGVGIEVLQTNAAQVSDDELRSQITPGATTTVARVLFRSERHSS